MTIRKSCEHVFDSFDEKIENLNITKTYPCNKKAIFDAVKMENFIGKFSMFSIYYFKILIVGTC